MKGPAGEDISTKSRWEQVESIGAGPRISYSDVDPEVLHAAVDVLTKDGDAITFGITADGGAFMVAVLSRGKVMKAYFDEAKMLEMRLRALKELD